MEQWFKVYNKIVRWQWHDTPEMLSMLIHLLAMANYEDRMWHGITVRRGQLVTSLSKLSSMTGISVKSVRTCLKRFEECDCVAIKRTNKYSLITICNYEFYQYNPDTDGHADGQAKGKQGASKGQHLQNNRIIEKEKESISKDIPKKENRFGDMEEAMEVWLEYKKEIRDAYKTERGMAACCNNLRRLSGGNPDTAMAIVEQSIANNWKGLFELKDGNDGKIRRPTEAERYGDAASLIAEKLARAKGDR